MVICMKNVILIGAGGYAKSVLDSIDYVQFNILGFVDEYKEGSHLGYKILGASIEEIEGYENMLYFICIGDNGRRTKWYQRIKSLGCSLINVSDKTALISRNCTIGEGNFFGKMAIINSGVTIGNNCIINTRALVEHGCTIEDNCNISTNAVLNGDVYVKYGALVGSCSVTNGQKQIGANAIIGSGSVIIKDVDDDCVVVGIPGKTIKRRERA